MTNQIHIKYLRRNPPARVELAGCTEVFITTYLNLVKVAKCPGGIADHVVVSVGRNGESCGTKCLENDRIVDAQKSTLYLCNETFRHVLRHGPRVLKQGFGLPYNFKIGFVELPLGD